MALAFGASLGTSTTDGSLSTSNTLTTSGAVPAGGFVVVCAHWYTDGGNAGTVTISGGGLTWTTDVDIAPGDELGRRVGIASAQAPSGLASSTVLTATFAPPGGGFNRFLDAAYFTGVATSSPKDAGSTIGNGTAAAWASGSLVTTNANDVLIGTSWQDFNVTTSTAAASYTEFADYNAATAGITASSVYRIVSSTGTYTPGGTWAASGQEWVACAVAYQAAGGGGGGTVVKNLAALGVG